MPDGYKTFEGSGVSFAYPSDWQVDERHVRRRRPGAWRSRRPDKAKTPYGLIRSASRRRRATASRASPTSAGSSIRDVNDGKIDSDEEVEIPGAKQALRATATTPPGRGSDPVEVKADSLDVLRDNDDVIVLTVASPAARGPDVRPGRRSSTPSG